MTDMTSAIQRPTAGAPVTPVYTQCTAADKFKATAGTRYMLHYKNGATPTGATASYVSEKAASAPPGAVPPAPAAPATKWSDLQVILPAGLTASTERVIVIDNISRYIDSLGFVNLLHGGTLTTLSVCIIGPLN